MELINLHGLKRDEFLLPDCETVSYKSFSPTAARDDLEMIGCERVLIGGSLPELAVDWQ